LKIIPIRLIIPLSVNALIVIGSISSAKFKRSMNVW